ncbi:FG-GAP repeat protein [Portibacter lacus]|nr:FG-GAP repeat protein [Portibacter lacus]
MKCALITILFYFLIFNQSLFGQNNNVGIGTNSPDASSKLEIESTDQGLLIPRLSSDARKAINSPAPGLLVYDTDKRTIYLFDGQKWLPFAFATDTASLPPTERTTGSLTTSLGYSLAIGSAGVVSGTDNGRVFMFKSDNGNYTEIEEIISTSPNPAQEKFGKDVAIAGDWLAVGAPGGPGDTSKVYIFERVASSWVQRQILKNNTFSEINSGFGFSVAMSGNRLVIGSPFNDPFSSADEGVFFIYTRNSTTYAPIFATFQPGGGNFAAGDYFGWDVDIEGDYILVGAPGHNNKEGKVYFYRIINNSLTLDYQRPYSTVDQPNVYYGYSVGIDPNGAIIGYPGGINNYGGYHIIGNFRNPAFGDESDEFEQYFITGESNNNIFTGASVSIDANHFIIGIPDKLNSLFSSSENNLVKSKANIYSYNANQTSFYLDFELLQSWESGANNLNGMGISTAVWNGRNCVGHDEDNRFYIKDFRAD